MKNVAFLVVDFINEFVNGNVSSPRAKHCIKPAIELVNYAHKNKIPVIFVNDMHDKKDKELKIWGMHSLKNSNSSKIYKEIPVNKNDIIIPKHTYTGFYNTKLNSTLKKLKINTLVIFGLYLNICVKYTLVDAYLNGYKIYLAKDATDAFTKETYEQSSAEIKTITDAKFVSNKQLFKELEK